MNKLLTKFKRLEDNTHENLDTKILEILKAKLSDDTKLKLKDMARSWEFTRTCSMIQRISYTLFLIMISKMQYIIYICMIFSTFENAGLITITYPFMIFGFALLEETRPTPRFWSFLKIWTTGVLFIKFFYNIRWEDIYENAHHVALSAHTGKATTVAGAIADKGLGVAVSWLHDIIKNVNHKVVDKSVLLGYLKLGLYRYDKPGELTDLVLYILPEVAILCFLMINSIYLRLIGYKNKSELDIENVMEGIDRVLERGDTKKVQEMKIMSYNMNLYHYFESNKL